MKIFKDIFTNDEMCSDSIPMKEIDDVVYQLQAKFITIDDTGFQLSGANASADGADADEAVDDGSRRVINLVESHQLQETFFDKKSFMGWLRVYLKKVKTYLDEKNPERSATFQTAAQAFIKEKILSRFDDFGFYTGASMDPEAGLALRFYEGESTDPAFWFFKDGLKGEKV